MKRVLIVIGLVLLVGLSVLATEKIVIGHRGAAGYLPEHTLEGYAYAHALGADYIEPDLVMTKDGQFICLHDIYLEPTTNVEEVFPDRRRNDGHWYAIDFTLDEIRELRVHERCKNGGEPYYPNRFPVALSQFAVPTFADMIELIEGLNGSTGRSVGIIPEIKRPSWHASEGLPMEEALLDALDRYGYTGTDANAFVQSFEPDSLKRLRSELESEIPLVQLISGSWAYAHMWTEAGLDEIAAYADAIGPSKGIIEANPEFVEWAHERGLTVFPYTFREDDLPAKYVSLDEEIRTFLFVYNVDGLFTDFPDVVRNFLSQ
ncbi:glycerophosphodiester phosphodiesterase [Candidatus Bipolaricaulota bacterium]